MAPPIGTLVAIYAPSSATTALGYVSQCFANGKVRVRTYGAIGSRWSWIVDAVPVNPHAPKDALRRVSILYGNSGVQFVAVV